MRIAVIGSTGRTGRLLVAQALDRGHEVIALARTPERHADLAEETARAPALRIVAADVAEPAGVRRSQVSVATRTALIVCIRFSAWSKTSERSDSKTSSETSR